MKARPGSGLLEALVAAVLGSLVLIASASLVISHERLARAVRERALRIEAIRTAALLPRVEWRALSPADIRGADGDSAASRLFRGFARSCPPQVVARRPASAAHGFAYTGVRDPDPAKDSAIVIAPDGTETVQTFTLGAPPPDCAPVRGRAITLAFSGAAPEPGSVILIFESGTYYLSGSALRYTRGSEGRQPLTHEYLDTRVSRFAPIRADASRGQAAASGISIRLHAGAVSAPVARVSFLNIMDPGSIP